MGVIVYVLLSGCPPFAGRTDREILSRVARAPLQFPARLWRGASHEARLFVARLLERDVEKRLTAEQALREPWLRVEHARPSARLCSETRHAARAFAKLDGLGKLVAHVVAARAPADRLEDCRRGFAALDRDGDGALGLSEFFLALGGEAGGCGVEEAAALFDAADASGVGRPLSFRAFAALHVGGGTLAPSERSLEDAFDVLDADGASAVSGDDVRAALGVDRCVGADERDAGAALEAHARALARAPPAAASAASTSTTATTPTRSTSRASSSRASRSSWAAARRPAFEPQLRPPSPTHPWSGPQVRTIVHTL